MIVALDSSATLAWVYDDERTSAIERVFDSVAVSGAWVPAIWRLEIANGLQAAIRQGRIDPAFRTRALAGLTNLAISIDDVTNDFAWTDTLNFADRFNLTLYDACYLELAQRRALPLATLDNDLRKAAKALDIPLLGA